jgi:hypothetical protein
MNAIPVQDIFFDDEATIAMGAANGATFASDAKQTSARPTNVRLLGAVPAFGFQESWKSATI